MSLDNIRARTAARKAEGQPQTYTITPPVNSTVPLPTLPCQFVGDELSGPEREAAGLGHNRKWRHCLNPDQPLGPHVCPCKGCGRNCYGYQPDEQ